MDQEKLVIDETIMEEGDTDSIDNDIDEIIRREIARNGPNTPF